MQRGQWFFRIGAVMANIAIAGGATAFGQQLAAVADDQAAAMLVFPYIAVDSLRGTDTVIQLGNASVTPIDIQCFYEDTTAHCSSATTTACFVAQTDCPFGSCLPGFSWTGFALHLTSGQPIGWRACKGIPDGGIPPVPEDPFVGVLRCITLGPTRAPTDQNVAEGAARIERLEASAFLDSARYNAIGIQAVAGANNGDGMLTLGAEYAACPRTTILTHFFEGATDPATGNPVRTALALVPCSVDYYLQQPTSLLVHYNVFNEFEQRLGTSKHFTAQQVGSLSAVNPSIFNVGVQGTLTGQTRLLPIGGGVLATTIETHQDVSDPSRESSAALNAHHTGAQPGGDTILLPP